MDEKFKKNLTHEIFAFPKKRALLFRKFPVQNQGFILLSFPKKICKEILDKLNNKEIVELIDYLDSDGAVDILQNMSSKRQKKILEELGKEIKEKIEYLLKFDPRTAAGLMSLDYIEVEENITFKNLSKLIKKHEKKTSKFPTILVVKDGFLCGEIHLSSLVFCNPDEEIKKHIKKSKSIFYDLPQKEVISVFEKNPHSKVIVLDKDKSVLGIIYSDDIIRLMQNQKNTLSDFAGVSKEEDVLDSVLDKVKYRNKWLIINLGTAFIAASVVSLFQETITAFILLAVYMPIIAGMGGNAGTQTLAVMVRGIALKEVNIKTAKKVIINELFAGGINGIIIGFLVTCVAIFWNQNPLFGLIVGLAMVVNLMVAGFFGAIIPLIMDKLGKDPASSASIFITTATDVFGFFFFLGLATLLL
jgi:magnesium transporter